VVTGAAAGVEIGAASGLVAPLMDALCAGGSPLASDALAGGGSAGGGGSGVAKGAASARDVSSTTGAGTEVAFTVVARRVPRPVTG
jgi:hypothetical protein